MTEELKRKAEQKYKEHLADPNYCENSEEESFYTGYVEGYLECQKANEWHYPSKGELPKEDTAEKETLYLLWFGLNDSDYMTGVFSHGRFWCFDCGWFDVKEVVAWKEIVPPSEPMRSLNKEEQKNYTEAINKVYKPTGVKLFDKESE